MIDERLMNTWIIVFLRKSCSEIDVFCRNIVAEPLLSTKTERINETEENQAIFMQSFFSDYILS